MMQYFIKNNSKLMISNTAPQPS